MSSGCGPGRAPVVVTIDGELVDLEALGRVVPHVLVALAPGADAALVADVVISEQGVAPLVLLLAAEDVRAVTPRPALHGFVLFASERDLHDITRGAESALALVGADGYSADSWILAPRVAAAVQRPPL